MMFKIISIFLIVMFVLGIFGKLRFPRIGKPPGQASLRSPRKCRNCGRFLIADEKCDCGRG